MDNTISHKTMTGDLVGGLGAVTRFVFIVPVMLLISGLAITGATSFSVEILTTVTNDWAVVSNNIELLTLVVAVIMGCVVAAETYQDARAINLRHRFDISLEMMFQFMKNSLILLGTTFCYFVSLVFSILLARLIFAMAGI